MPSPKDKPKSVTKHEPSLAPVPAEKPSSTSVPAYLQNRKTSTESSMRQQDLIIPRVKLLQGLSPELENFDEAEAGTFWHNILNEPIGDDDEANNFEFIVFKSRYLYLLFAPRGDDRVILARAEDGVHWRPSTGEFRVKPKGSKDHVVYKMAPTVEGSGLAEFGSAIPGDPESKPAATLVYEYLSYMPKRAELGAMVLSLTRSQIKKGKVINSAHRMLNAPMSGMKFKASIVQEQSADGPFYNWQFSRAGWATEEEANRAEDYATAFKSRTYTAAGEGEYAEEGEGGPTDAPANVKGF